MKKVAGLIILVAILILCFPVSNAESGIRLYWGDKTYTLDEAAAADSGFPFKVEEGDGTVELSDAASGIKATVRSFTLDEDAIESLRNYYKDNKSTGDQLFDKYLKLERSYIPAMQDLFAASFLYGNQDNPLSETNMKLFYEGSDTVFGQKAEVYLYNIFKSEGLNYSEETHLDLSVPYAQTHTLVSIGFVIKSGYLSNETSIVIGSMLRSICPEGMQSQTDKLTVLGDKNILDAANSGIYPIQSAEPANYTTLGDDQAGFSLSYPSGCVPYMQNNIGGRIQYKSYKINPNQIFSVSAEPLEAGSSAEAAANAVRTLVGQKAVKAEGKEEINGRLFYYVKYSQTKKDVATYTTDYYTAVNSALCRLQLSSRLEEPSAAIQQQFRKILESFTVTPPADIQPLSAPVLKTYLNKEEGYSFSYPEGWQLTDVSENISYDRLRLVYPELSGAMDITVSEGELSKEIKLQNLPSCITGISSSEADPNVKSYKAPYDGCPVKVLSLSTKAEGSVIYVYRLLDYLDSNGRNRLSFCTDIIKGVKIYSMFITIGEYETENGVILDQDINATVCAIAASFRNEATEEAKARAASGETRNRKVVFVENSLRKKVDPKLTVASVENTAANGSIYVKVAGSKANGYYRVKPDFARGSLDILDKTLINDILKKELDKLKAAYKNRIITSAKTDEANMAIVLESRKDKSSPVFTWNYRMDVSFNDKGITWKSVRPDRAEELRRESIAFVNAIFNSNMDVQFSYDDVFKDIDSYVDNKLPYRVLVHVSSKSISGFLTFEVDPADDSMKIISLKLTDMILREADTKYEYGRFGYMIKSSSFDDKNFILKLELRSTTGGADATDNLKVWYNPETQQLDFKSI